MSIGSKAELDAISDFQKDLHTANENGEISSHFYTEFKGCMWHTTSLIQMNSSQKQDDLVFEADPAFHYLMLSYMRQEWPAIKIKEEYRNKVQICWPHNLATSYCNKAAFVVDDETNNIKTMDRVDFDNHHQFMIRRGFSDSYNKDIGNVPFLEEWSDILPRFVTNCPQPWPYCKDTASAFPLFPFAGSKVKVYHRYNIERRITKILRMRVVDDKSPTKWREIPVNTKFLSGIKEGTRVPKPQLWAYYALNTENEIKWHKCRSEIVYYTDDIINCDLNNTNTYGSTAEIKISSSTPCSAIFFMAENKDALDLNCYSNYTTCTNDVYKGWSPIKSCTLKYGTITKFDNMPIDHFTGIMAYYHFPSAPRDAGYCAYSYAHEPCSTETDIGLTLKDMNATLSLKIANTDPLLSLETKEEKELDNEDDDLVASSARPDKKVERKTEDSPKFIARVRLMVRRRLEIKKKKDSEDFVIRVI